MVQHDDLGGREVLLEAARDPRFAALRRAGLAAQRPRDRDVINFGRTNPARFQAVADRPNRKTAQAANTGQFVFFQCSNQLRSGKLSRGGVVAACGNPENFRLR